MDYAYRIARNSYCLQGNMGCLMVRNVRKGEGDRKYEKMPDEIEIIVRVVNAALLKPLLSDCHAEANAVSVCAATGTKLGEDVTCYVTKAPCTECFKLITMARIGRVVCPEPYTSTPVQKCAERLNMEWIQLRSSREEMNARDAHAAQFEDRERIQKLRMIRKNRRARIQKEKAINKANRKRKLEESIRAKEEKKKAKKEKKEKKEKKISDGDGSSKKEGDGTSKKGII